MPKGTTYMFHLTSYHFKISDKNLILDKKKNLHTLKFSMKTVDFFFVLEMCPKAIFCTKNAQ